MSKTLNNLLPSLMSNIFQLRLTNRPPRGKYKLNLEIPKNKQVKFGTKSLRAFGPKIWNSSTHHIKSAEDVKTFKRIIKKWNVYNVSAQFAQITFIRCSVFVTITVHPLQYSFYFFILIYNVQLSILISNFIYNLPGLFSDIDIK